MEWWMPSCDAMARIKANSRACEPVPVGHIFIPMHFPEHNVLTLTSFDPYSRQPAYKGCAVRAERVNQSSSLAFDEELDVVR
jgi:anaerobic selenocysteine-containing dehydrogenase